MDEMESKLNSILSNPQMMEQIMAMAQSMGGSSAPVAPPVQDTMPQIDISMLQKLSGFAQCSRMEPKEQTLLQALGPYLSHNRINKLEKAMRAAKLAKVASTMISAGGLPL